MGLRQTPDRNSTNIPEALGKTLDVDIQKIGDAYESRNDAIEERNKNVENRDIYKSIKGGELNSSREEALENRDEALVPRQLIDTDRHYEATKIGAIRLKQTMKRSNKAVEILQTEADSVTNDIEK